jgi:hypothetical protein
MRCILQILLTLHICVNSYYTVVTNITGISVTNIKPLSYVLQLQLINTQEATEGYRTR